LRSEARAGISFRVKDDFNYYVFEVEKTSEGGRRRVRRFLNGVSKTLIEEFNGGYLLEKWYRIRIVAIKDKFIV